MTELSRLSSGDSLPDVRGRVTQETINGYADLSADFNPLHVDPEFARTTEFGGTIAHGPLGLSFIFQLVTRHVPNGWPQGAVLRATFLGPVRPGDELVARGTVKNRSETADGVRLEIEATCENHRGEKVLAATVDLPLKKSGERR